MEDGVGKTQGIAANGDESFGVDFDHCVDGLLKCLVEDNRLDDRQDEYVLFFLFLEQLLKNVENTFIYFPAWLALIGGLSHKISGGFHYL